jgi:hypothetical protein
MPERGLEGCLPELHTNFTPERCGAGVTECVAGRWTGQKVTRLKVTKVTGSPGVLTQNMGDAWASVRRRQTMRAGEGGRLRVGR